MYTRDAAGNVTQVVDNGADPDVANPAAGVASAVKECFLYDSWNRLVRATSAATAATCPTSSSAATIATGTRDAYDTVWSFNDVNRMVSRTDKLTAAATTYTYGDAAHPSALTATSGGVTGTYGYNSVGAMTSRNGTTLSYDALQRLTGYGAVESYRYSVSNQRIMRTAGTTRTLYLPGVEVTDAAGSVTLTRFLTIGGANVATKTTTGAGTSVAWNCGSLQNSTVCQADAASPGVVPARKRYAPYGGDRNAVTFTTTDHQFLGQPDDSTGLTYLNNRYYDPTLGVFTSVDPLVGKTGTPYLYAAGNPTTLSDPSGLCATGGGWIMYAVNDGSACPGAVVGPNGVYYGKVSLPPQGTGSVPANPLPQSHGASGYGQSYCDDPEGGMFFDACQQPVKDEGTGTPGADKSLVDIVGGPAAKQTILDGLLRFFCEFSAAHGQCSYDSGNFGPDTIDKVAGHELVAWAHPTAVYTCGESASGAAITCVDAQRVPSMQAAGAVTMGHYVFCQDSCDSALLLAHEFVHVHQYEVNGDTMVSSYLVQTVLNGYYDNPYEVEAYNVQDYLKGQGWK